MAALLRLRSPLLARINSESIRSHAGKFSDYRTARNILAKQPLCGGPKRWVEAVLTKPAIDRLLALSLAEASFERAITELMVDTLHQRGRDPRYWHASPMLSGSDPSGLMSDGTPRRSSCMGLKTDGQLSVRTSAAGPQSKR